MKMSEILNSTKTVNNKKRYVQIGLLVTGILSLLVIFVTIYGQHAGVFTISITKEAYRKGIAISTSIDFPEDEYLSSLKVNPAIEVDNIVEQVIRQEEAENTDGQYIDPDRPDYIAYTFYLTNTGSEVVDVNYTMRVLSQHKKIGNATSVKIIESLYNEEKKLVEKLDDALYPQIGLSKDNEVDIDIKGLRPRQIKKFTVLIWFNGPDTDETMIGGAIKLDWVFSIQKARKEDVIS